MAELEENICGKTHSGLKQRDLNRELASYIKDKRKGSNKDFQYQTQSETKCFSSKRYLEDETGYFQNTPSTTKAFRSPIVKSEFVDHVSGKKERPGAKHQRMQSSRVPIEALQISKIDPRN